METIWINDSLSGPIAIVELEGAPEPALELHLWVREHAVVGVWLTEDGAVLATVIAGLC